MREKIVKIIEDVMGLKIDSLDHKQKLNTISGWDSFNNLMLISTFQDTFHIEFTAVEIEQVDTVEKVISLVEKKVDWG